MITLPSYKARRLTSRRLLWLIRRAVLTLALFAGAAPVHAEILGARYADPTTRYAHGILGDAIEHGALVIRTDRAGAADIKIVLPLDSVFEDTNPRLVDVDAEGDAEIMVVESHRNAGAQLAIYDETGKIAATPHIGRPNRWLAPIGAADFDGDGLIELAYIDRPHLAKTLRVWRFVDGKLVPVADLAGLTNHRIGERDIGGGIRNCGQGAEMITASANWRDIMASTLKDGVLTTRVIGRHTGRASLNAALDCK